MKCERNALQIACGHGNEKIVDILLSAGARVEERSSSSQGRGAEETTQRAPKSSIVVARYNGRTALQAASERGHEKIVARLLELGADVNAPPSPTAGTSRDTFCEEWRPGMSVSEGSFVAVEGGMLRLGSERYL